MTGYSKTDISDINKFYWRKIKQSLSNLEAPSIYVTGLGRFVIRQTMVFKVIKKYFSKLVYWQKRKFGSPQHCEYEKDYNTLSEMGEILKQEWRRKEEHIKNKKK